jgi:hypothetical protein
MVAILAERKRRKDKEEERINISKKEKEKGVRNISRDIYSFFLFSSTLTRTSPISIFIMIYTHNMGVRTRYTGFVFHRQDINISPSTISSFSRNSTTSTSSIPFFIIYILSRPNP